jgi:hypothetical protein
LLLLDLRLAFFFFGGFLLLSPLVPQPLLLFVTPVG